MSWTKREFCLTAFEELGLSDANYNLQDSQLKTALKRLDSLLANWNGKAIRIAYPLTSSPTSDTDLEASLDVDTTVPDVANEAIYLNLAIRMASAFGKPVSLELKTSARDAYKTLLSYNAYPLPTKKFTPLPAGAGKKVHIDNSQNFILPEDSYIDVGSDGELDLLG